MPSYALLPTIDQQATSTVFGPEGDGEGNWVGVPAVHEHDGRTLLAIRQWTPEWRGHAIEIHRSTAATAATPNRHTWRGASTATPGAGGRKSAVRPSVRSTMTV